MMSDGFIRHLDDPKGRRDLPGYAMSDGKENTGPRV
jgi:hypothetical protein